MTTTIDNYLLIITGDVDPETYGPYPDEITRDKAAIEHYARDPDRNDGIYRIDIINDRPHVIPYSGGFFDSVFVRKGKFSIEGGPAFKGFTDGAQWNGWAVPLFTRDIAKIVIATYNGDDEGDCGYSDFKFDAPDLVIDPDTQKTIEVYNIGGGGWVWSEEDCV